MNALSLACRRWSRRRALAATICGVLALGIGAATAMYSVVDAVLLRPLPFPEAERLVLIHATLPDRKSNPAFASTWRRTPVSWSTWRDLERAGVFEKVGAWQARDQILGPDRTEIVRVIEASSSYLSLLGATPVIGRSFTEAEDHQISESVLLTHNFWQTQFGGRLDVLGREVLVAPTADSPLQSKVVVGVLSPNAAFPGESPDLLLPLGLMAWNGSFETNRFLRLIARLAPGVSAAKALTVSEPLVRRTESMEQRSAAIETLLENRAGTAIRPLWMMFTASGLLLLVACANAAALLLNDVRTRRHEIGLRVALGASRRNLLAQLVAEHSVLVLVAGAAGLLVSVWMTPALLSLAPHQFVIDEPVTVDRHVVLGSIALTVFTSLVFSVAPSLALAKRVAGGAAGTNRTTDDRLGQRLIVAAQVGLTFVLLVGAAFLAATFAALTSRPLGFAPNGLVVASVRYGDFPIMSEEALNAGLEVTITGANSQVRNAYARRMLSGWIHTNGLLEEIRRIPGVTHATVTTGGPFTGSVPAARVWIDQRPDIAALLVPWLQVTENYFATLGLPVVKGRGLMASDRHGPNVIVVSREFERQLLDGDGLRKRITTSSGTYEVVGVAENARHTGLADEELMTCYRLDRAFVRTFDVIVRTNDPKRAFPSLRETIGSYDRHMSVASLSTMDQLVDRTAGAERFRATLSVTFALLALALAAVGTYGVASRYVADRRSEIGIRLALGAHAADIRNLVVRDGLATVGAGIAAGLPFAYAVSRLVRGVLFGIEPADPRAFAIAACVLAVTALCAIFVPALRAGRLDPLVAIREQ